MLDRNGVRWLVVGAAIGVLISAPALAAQDPAKAAAKAAEKEARRAAFHQGHASTKGKVAAQPKNEAQAVTTKRVVKAGVIEMRLPEDRMLELVEIKHPDGTVTVGHTEHEARAKRIEEAVQ